MITFAETSKTLSVSKHLFASWFVFCQNCAYI